MGVALSLAAPLPSAPEGLPLAVGASAVGVLFALGWFRAKRGRVGRRLEEALVGADVVLVLALLAVGLQPGWAIAGVAVLVMAEAGAILGRRGGLAAWAALSCPLVVRAALGAPAGGEAGAVGSLVPLLGAGLATTILAAVMADELGAERHRRRRAEADELRRLQRLVDGLDAILWTAEPDPLRFTFVSKRAEELLGYPVDRWLSDAGLWAAIIRPEDRERAVALCREATAEGRDHVLDYGAVAADGRTVFLRDIVRVHTDAEGRPTGLVGIMLDVSHEKAMERELRRQEAILRAVTFAAQRFLAARSWREVVPQVVPLVGQAAEVDRVLVVGGTAEGNGTAGVRLAWPDPPGPSDGAGGDGSLPWRALLDAEPGPAAARPEAERAALRALGLGEEGSVLVVPVVVGGTAWGLIVLADGDPARRWSAAEVDALGAAASALGSAIDREEKDRALREAESRYRALVEEIPAVLYVNLPDESFTNVYLSPQVTELLGYTPEDIGSRPGRWWDLVHPEDREAAMREALEGRAAPGPIRQEYRVVRADGRTVWIRDEFTVVRDEEGRPILLQGVISDITELKATQAELEQSLEMLRRAGRQRKALLHRLVAAQEEERRRIAADIHDDPIQKMTAVGLRLAAIRRQVDDQGAATSLDRLQATVALAVQRLRHLLFELRPVELDRDGLAAALRQELEHLAEDGGPAWRLEDRLVEEPEPEARLMAYRIAQEALANVRKHARAGRLDLTLESRGDELVVRIRDDGRGFDPHVGPPSGHLGLTSMRERAEMAGGWFRVDSAPGRGTTVEFGVPLATAPLPPRQPAELRG
jgi:PAS domain S-box-containing protein